jgi:hypothetical protein
MTPTPQLPDAASPSAHAAESPAPAAPAAAGGLKPIHLVAIAAAIAGGALVTLLAMSARPSAVAPTRELKTAGASPAASPSAPAIDAAAPVKWTSTGQARWVNPSRVAAAFEVAAERPVAIWNGTVTPTLVVRCNKGRVDAFVFTSSAARIEAEDENHTVKLEFDARPSAHERWPDSVEHDALFAPDGRAFVEQLASSQALRFTFAPHNAGPAAALFDVRGLKEKMAATRACQK